MIESLVALMAGALTTLSPCVLPLLPFVLASAAEQHRLGPLALTGGMSLSFVTLGVGLFGLGSALDFGPDRATVRMVTAAVMVLFGAVLMSAALQQRFALAGARVTSGLNPVLERFSLQGISGQLVLGMLLGAAWTPCSGATLGAAVGLASSSDTIGRATWIMALFSAGASLPLLALAYGSRRALQSRRGMLAKLGRSGKPVLGAMLVAMGLLIAFGVDKALEASLVNAMPDWLIDLTTRF